jgi:ABC-type nitrate/sulfonate/bicarbonate transport system ATPase subunit
VTHDRDEAATIADRTVLLADIDANPDRRSEPGATPPTAGG